MPPLGCIVLFIATSHHSADAQPRAERSSQCTGLGVTEQSSAVEVAIPSGPDVKRLRMQWRNRPSKIHAPIDRE